MHNGVRYDSLSQGWYDYLDGHVLRFIPNLAKQDFGLIARGSDVIVYTGGDRDPIRDLVEDRLLAAALDAGKPIIGICHGFQRLTEMLGGSVEPIDGHADVGHDIFDGSGGRHWVNSHHRFRVKDVPRGSMILATDTAGNVESWLRGSIGGVMWHPERGPFDWLPGELAQILFP